MDLGEDEDFAFKHPYFFENFTFKFEGLNPETQRDFENVVKSMGAKIFDDAEYILTDILHASSDPKNYYSISYLSDSMEAETPLEIEDYKFANLIVSISQSKFCCVNAKYIWKNKSCLSYYNENICCKSCIRTRELHCDELSEESNNLCFDQVNGETNISNINYLNKESQCVNIGDLNKESQCVNIGDLHKESQRVNIGDLNKESQCVNIGDLNKESQCVNIGDLNKESQCVNIGALNKQINGLQVDDNFDNVDNFAMYDNYDEDLDDFAEQPQTNGVSHENAASQNNSDSNDMEIVEIQTNNDLEKPSCSTQRSKASKAHKQSTMGRQKRVKKISSDSDTSSKNEDSHNSTKRPKTLETNKPSTIDRWKKKRIISSDSETSNKSEELEEPTRKRKSKRQRLTSSPSPETVTNKSSSDCEYIPGSEASSSNLSSTEEQEQDFIIRTNKNKKDWWLQLPPPETTKKSGVSRKRDYEFNEKRIMLAYLIINDLIEDGTSRKPWEKMLKDGYLTGRSVESLNNHFRKTLLQKIESFKLPKDLEDRFIECRNCHIRRK